MLQILHVSDLHLFVEGALHNDLLSLRAAGFPYRHLSQFYTFAWTPAQNALGNALRKVAGDEPALLVVSGDIAALPYASSAEVEQHFYTYVRSLLDALAPSSKILIILGNHDWTTTHTTPFATTSFDTIHRVRAGPRTAYFSHGGVAAIAYLVDSTDAMLPATGEVRAPSLNYLANHFRDGHRNGFLLGAGVQLSPKSYDQAIKVLVLHHYTLPWTAYQNLKSWEHLSLRLTNRGDLLRVCKGEIDIMLFGHSHCPTFQSCGGPIMVDAGSTLGTTVASPPNAQFQHIVIKTSDEVEIQGYEWDGGKADYINCTRMPFKRNRSGVWSENP